MESKHITQLINQRTPDVIVDRFFRLTRQPQNESEISEAYVGSLHRHNDPFQYTTYGGYHLTHYFEALIYQRGDGYYKRTYDISDQEVEAALRDYGREFQIGFMNFENDIVKGKSPLFNERSDYCQTIFDYATGITSDPGGYPETIGSKDKHVLSGWGRAGKEMGYFYRSWYIILESPKVFEPFFSPIPMQKESFIDFFIRGIRALQEMDVNAECIRNARKGKLNEHEFRNYFISWFKAGHFSAAAEIEKGNGRIDLKVEHPAFGTNVIEFKGWWNHGKKHVIDQVKKYITEFDQEAVIFMIDHLKDKDIADEYRSMFTEGENNKCDWRELRYIDTGFRYFASDHFFPQKKTIYHLIYRVHA